MFEELSFLSLVSDVIRPVLSWTTDCLNGTSVAGQGTREHASSILPVPAQLRCLFLYSPRQDRYVGIGAVMSAVCKPASVIVAILWTAR